MGFVSLFPSQSLFLCLCVSLISLSLSLFFQSLLITSFNSSHRVRGVSFARQLAHSLHWTINRAEPHREKLMAQEVLASSSDTEEHYEFIPNVESSQSTENTVPPTSSFNRAGSLRRASFRRGPRPAELIKPNLIESEEEAHSLHEEVFDLNDKVNLISLLSFNMQRMHSLH